MPAISSTLFRPLTEQCNKWINISLNIVSLQTEIERCIGIFPHHTFNHIALALFEYFNLNLHTICSYACVFSYYMCIKKACASAAHNYKWVEERRLYLCFNTINPHFVVCNKIWVITWEIIQLNDRFPFMFCFRFRYLNLSIWSVIFVQWNCQPPYCSWWYLQTLTLR